MDNVIHELENYFEKVHKNKIFFLRLTVANKSFHVMYDYDKKDEIAKYVSNFTEYLPYYVYPADTLETIDITKDIAQALQTASKTCWEGPNIPTRQAKVNGIFGEVFLDFYERIVNKAKVACVYSYRRDFRSNFENKGFDNALFLINNDKIEFVFAESKFVADIKSATDSLVKDIKGEPATADSKEIIGHLTKEFLNDYIEFIIGKNGYFSDEEKALLKPFVQNLNSCLVTGKTDFISYLIQNDIRINCVFFAIFKNKNTDPNAFIGYYDAIEKEAITHLKNMGFTNYNIEIVFIPTQSKSMDIKGAIDGYY